MKKEFIVERQGRAFVLYAGLLDLAHQNGLKSIHTELVQTPSEANQRVAIVRATVVMEQNGVERIFTGIGDAAPNNVAPAMQNCLLRMAETRSKARALRDAVNVGVAALEELGDADALDSAPERGYPVGRSKNTGGGRVPLSHGPATPRQNGVRTESRPEPRPERTAPPTEGVPIPDELRHPVTVSASELPLLEQQAEAIRKMSARRGQDADVLARERFNIEGVQDLTQAQASELIRVLNQPANGKTPTLAN